MVGAVDHVSEHIGGDDEDERDRNLVDACDEHGCDHLEQAR